MCGNRNSESKRQVQQHQNYRFGILKKRARECYCSLSAVRLFLTLLGNAPEEEDRSVVCCSPVEGPSVCWYKSSVCVSNCFSYAACFEPKGEKKVLVWKQFSCPLLEPEFSLCVSFSPLLSPFSASDCCVRRHSVSERPRPGRSGSPPQVHCHRVHGDYRRRCSAQAGE